MLKYTELIQNLILFYSYLTETRLIKISFGHVYIFNAHFCKHWQAKFKVNQNNEKVTRPQLYKERNKLP